MSKRLQVLIEPGEYRTFQKIAKKGGLSMGEWVRQSLRHMSMSISSAPPRKKIEHIRNAIRYRFSTGPVDQVINEIEKGYLGE